MEGIDNQILKDTNARNEKIYSRQAILGGALLGGPLIAGYLINENFKAFDEHERVTRVWIVSVVATTLIFALGLFLGHQKGSPGIAIPLIVGNFASYFAQKTQGDKMKEHIEAGGTTYGFWHVVGVSLIGFAITIAVMAVPAGILYYEGLLPN